MGVGMVHNFDGDDRAGLTVMVLACLQIVSHPVVVSLAVTSTVATL